MKKQLLSVSILAATLAATPVMAEDLGAGLEGSMNVALTSDYVWRGISQTNTQSAVQGGADISHTSGLYAGVWASSVDFNDDDGKDATSEWDYYYGYGTELGGVGIDVGYIAYTYPGDETALNFEELYANLSYGFGDMGTLTVGAAGSGRITGEESTLYTSVSYEAEVMGVGLKASAGNYDYNQDTYGTRNDYNDYLLAVSKSYFGADWALTWTDTDLSDGDCGDGDNCDQIIAVSVSKSL